MDNPWKIINQAIRLLVFITVYQKINLNVSAKYSGLLYSSLLTHLVLPYKVHSPLCIHTLVVYLR